ncbi:MAG: CoA pyrophosphatase [Bowdeniella nasicola]|nr:CoA pyrophosphatase [Bowdeniella nasicola]
MRTPEARWERIVSASQGTPAPAAATNRRAAAVLMGLSDDADPAVLLIRRTARLRSHPGQVAFPGGSLEAGEGPVQAALREAREEVGLDPDTVRVRGILTDRATHASPYLVTPVLASLPATRGAAGAWHTALEPRDTGEVASVHTPRISELADPGRRFTATLQGRPTGPGFAVDGLIVWGFTGGLIDWLLRAGGWEVPWDRARTRKVPAAFYRPAGAPSSGAGSQT